jgi:uncharacterized phage-like protein YoqJ
MSEASTKACSFTGHRHIKADKQQYVRRQLQDAVWQAIQDGFTCFVSGFAEGADLLFAAIVVDMKKKEPSIALEAAIPYRDRLDAKDPLFNELLNQCDHIQVVCEAYSPDCFLARNKYLVEHSERVIAVFDGRRRSGTAQTIRIAKEQNRELYIISV